MTIVRSEEPSGLSFSSSVRARGSGTWVYTAGKLGADASGAIVSGGLAAQARAALDNVLASVAEAGGTAANVLKITVYVTTLENYGEFNSVRRDLFGSTLPASTAVVVAALLQPEAVIEIDAVAFVPDADDEDG